LIAMSSIAHTTKTPGDRRQLTLPSSIKTIKNIPLYTTIPLRSPSGSRHLQTVQRAAGYAKQNRIP